MSISLGFTSDAQSHQHSLETLNCLYKHDDFMESIGTMADLGCGSGLDLEWWATRTTQEDFPKPLDIRCTGIDVRDNLAIAHKYRNITYQKQNFEQPILIDKRTFDLLWCHDSFQYVIDPFKTLANWWEVTSENGMLVIVVPQTTNLQYNKQAFDQQDFCYYNWTIVSLIHILAVNGWDCAGGFFKKNVDDPWLHAAVYRSEHKPMDPRTTTWYDLAEKKLLPPTAVQSITRHGYLRQQDLTLPWLDHGLYEWSKQ